MNSPLENFSECFFDDVFDHGTLGFGLWSPHESLTSVFEFNLEFRVLDEFLVGSHRCSGLCELIDDCLIKGVFLILILKEDACLIGWVHTLQEFFSALAVTE